MNHNAIPTLKLEVEGMKSAIITHLGVRGSELGDALDSEITKAVDSYPWQEAVFSIVHDAITKHIDVYFKYGKGKRAIVDAVDEGFKAVIDSTESLDHV